MSRSYKKPWGGICHARSGEEKFFKKKSNRVIRRMPIDEEIPKGNSCKHMAWEIYSFPKDGKRFQGDDPKWKRK